MLRGTFQRAAMAIVLIGLMLAPLGFCLQRSTKDKHSCCMKQAAAHILRSDCCVVRTPLPATLARPTLPSASPSAAVYEYGACVKVAAPDEHPAIAPIPTLSPPPGAFPLRI